MSRFNLIHDPWIKVIVDRSGESKEISLSDLFNYAHKYLGLGGDTQTQNFAVLRVLLAITQTVYSRLDADGKPYSNLNLDEKFLPQNELKTNDKMYSKAMMQTWLTLWDDGVFSQAIQHYLEAWEERFYLFDENYPFFQVTKEEILEDKINKKKAGSIMGKNMNRLISESGNKQALFSPKYDKKDNKNILSEAEIARWLITFQCYTGLADKTIFGTEKYKTSKGWLFDIGGLYLGGENLFETLMLNTVLIHPENQFTSNHQKPCWEYSGQMKIQHYLSGHQPDNLAELYTLWSRAIYIDPEVDINDAFSMDIVKLPELDHENQFLELMTLWRFNKNGPSKDTFTPRKHQINQAIWKSFGLIALPSTYSDAHRMPGIMNWLNNINKTYKIKSSTLYAVSMRDDGNATSWVPIDEIVDELRIDDYILTDIEENHWVVRIYEAVEQTKKVADFIYRQFILDILKIRNVKNTLYSNQKRDELYFLIDQPFRDWIESIDVDEPKDEKIQEWLDTLREIVVEEAQKQVRNGTSRDFIGITNQDNEVVNLPIVYNKFMNLLNLELNHKMKEEK